MKDKVPVTSKEHGSKWIDSYLSGEMSGSVFCGLIVLDYLSNQEIALETIGTINIAIDYLFSKKHLSPKEEQKIKNELANAKTAFNNGDESGIKSAMAEIIEIVK